MDTQIQFNDHVRSYLEAQEEALGVPIRVVHVSQYNYEPTAFDGLTLVSWGIPGPFADWTYPTLGPITTDCYEGSVGPVYALHEHDGYELVELARDLFAQVGPSVIYYPFSLNTHTFSHEGYGVIDCDKVFGQLVEKAMDPALIEGMAERACEAEARRWSDWCTGARNRALTQLRSTIESREKAAAEYQQTLAQVFTQLRDLGAQASAIEAAITMSADDWQRLWDKLKEHPRITKLEFNRFNNIVITTDMITMQHPRHGDRTLGRFEITLGVSEDMDIVFKNLDYPRNGRHHPHITSDGNACWGDVGATIAKYMGELQLVGLVEMLFAFLESFNEDDDWGRFAALWYDVPDALEVEREQAQELGLVEATA
jgi:hypothetical protein